MIEHLPRPDAHTAARTSDDFPMPWAASIRQNRLEGVVPPQPACSD